MSFLYAKIYKRTGRDKFSVSVYRKKQDEECVKQNGDFYNMNVHCLLYTSDAADE